MHDERLARAILGKLDEVSPQPLHLYQLQAALPEFKNASPQVWYAAVEALKRERHLEGNFGVAPDMVANLRITPLGRRELRGSASVASTKPDGGTFLNFTSLQKQAACCNCGRAPIQQSRSIFLRQKPHRNGPLLRGRPISFIRCRWQRFSSASEAGTLEP